MVEDIVDSLRIRAKIRRNAKDRRSVQENKPDRLADLLERAADEIEHLRKCIEGIENDYKTTSTRSTGQSG